MPFHQVNRLRDRILSEEGDKLIVLVGGAHGERPISQHRMPQRLSDLVDLNALAKSE